MNRKRITNVIALAGYYTRTGYSSKAIHRNRGNKCKKELYFICGFDFFPTITQFNSWYWFWPFSMRFLPVIKICTCIDKIFIYNWLLLCFSVITFDFFVLHRIFLRKQWNLCCLRKDYGKWWLLIHFLIKVAFEQ